eukprot:g30132.t1
MVGLRKSSAGSGSLLHRRLSWKDTRSPSRQCLQDDEGHDWEDNMEMQDRISDARSIPSQSDHHYIVNSLQQGLDNVDEVIIYDTEQVDSEREEEPQTLEVRFWQRALLRLWEIGKALCGCHAGLQ